MEKNSRKKNHKNIEKIYGRKLSSQENEWNQTSDTSLKAISALGHDEVADLQIQSTFLIKNKTKWQWREIEKRNPPKLKIWPTSRTDSSAFFDRWEWMNLMIPNQTLMPISPAEPIRFGSVCGSAWFLRLLLKKHKKIVMTPLFFEPIHIWKCLVSGN